MLVSLELSGSIFRSLIRLFKELLRSSIVSSRSRSHEPNLRITARGLVFASDVSSLSSFWGGGRYLTIYCCFPNLGLCSGNW